MGGPSARACLAAISIIVCSALTLPLGVTHPHAQEATWAEARNATAPTHEELGRLLDAVVETTERAFWDKDRLEAIGWKGRAAALRESVLDAASYAEAAQRINQLLGELKTSHTTLFTPEDVDYYVLLDVFTSGGRGGRGDRRRNQQDLAAMTDRHGVRFAGIGMFTARLDDRDFVDAILEGSPAERAGLKAGDEIVSVDGDKFHPILSFRGKIGQQASIAVRRTKGGPVGTVTIDVVRIAPLKTFGDATRESARVIERGDRRIGYVHVWASVGDRSAQALTDALEKLGVKSGVARVADEGGEKRQGEAAAASPSRPIDALIIDMRGRIGGTATNATSYLEILDPRGPRIRWLNKAHSSRPANSLRGRMAVLIDHHTRSTGELFVHAYKRERQGPLIGTRTAGAVSGGASFAMPGANLLYMAVSGLEVDGDVVEGAGVAPDLEVPRQLPYAGGADPVIDAAVDYLARSNGTHNPNQPRMPGTSQ
jgi:carboxyl-terminal processing protease